MADRSLRGLFWAEPEETDIQVPEVPQEVVTIAVNRGITNFKEYFKPTIPGSMPDPLVLKDMDKAVARGVEACQKGEKVYVYGDYDVDGATSTAILTRYLRAQGCEVNFYIPERLTEGYGPNVPAMKKIAKKGTDLLIVADSGTTAFEPLEEAERLGMDIIILDHHTALERHPPGILVNPNRLDETREYSYLCTAGIALFYVVGLQRALREIGWFEGERNEYPMHGLMGIAALGTVCDVVPLVGFNRALVKHGVPLMARVPGLKALAAANGVDPKDFDARTCGFVFGPCINAAGRIDSTIWGSKLLTCDDEAECAKIAAQLLEFNVKRKQVQNEMEAAAQEQAKEQAKTSRVIVVYDEAWHPGVIGIVAARIKEAHDRPAIVIGQGGKGSARSVDGFDVGGPIIAAQQEGILIKGGGHPMAGGLTIDPARLEDFRAYMNKSAENFERPPLEVDYVANGEAGLGKTLVESFKMLAPFGAGNPEPRVALCDVYLQRVQKLKDKHVKAYANVAGGKVDIILFNSVGTPMGDALLSAEGKQVSLYGKVDLNEYMGRTTVQIKPEDIWVNMPAEPEPAGDTVDSPAAAEKADAAVLQPEPGM